MVMGLRKKLDAFIYIATTCLAGGGSSETKEKQVGTVFVSFLFNGKAE